jgi:hypothetical protein
MGFVEIVVGSNTDIVLHARVNLLLLKTSAY